MIRDPGVDLVRLALAGERDVDGELLPGTVLAGPLDRPLDGAEDLQVRGLAAWVVEGHGDDQAFALAVHR